MTYPEALDYLDSFINYERKNSFPYKDSFKLERFSNFLDFIGRPQDGLKFLHVAGTKGKGSVCVFLAYILKESGFKAGLYTSPHLSDVRERIRVLQRRSACSLGSFEGMISKRELTALVNKLKSKIEKYNSISKYGALSFFEVYTGLALEYFKERKVDYAVLETGLGGRLDATNAVSSSVCGITNISFDHMDKLGNTLSQIAKEKAGIIKGSGACVVSAKQRREAQRVIRKHCKEKNVKLYEVGKDIFWYGLKKGKNGQKFSVRGIKKTYRNLRIRMFGEHQVDNAVQAIGMIETLRSESISLGAIKRGLMAATWPGRLELVYPEPRILLDGAQNAASAESLYRALKGYFSYRRLILILGISRDKDIKGICDVVCKAAHRIILTQARNPRAADPMHIKKIIGRNADLTYNVKDAVSLAMGVAQKKDLVLITGSLFVVGEVRKMLTQVKRLDIC